jgi:hypothetical protein
LLDGGGMSPVHTAASNTQKIIVNSVVNVIEA